MHLDVRLPMGYLFLLLGVILAGYDLVSAQVAHPAQLLGVNINLLWGVLFAAFGALMLWLAKRTKSS